MFGAEEDAYRRGVEDGVRQEGERILEHIRRGVASWEREPDKDLRGWVQASLECLATCITHRGVSREQAIAKALASLQPQPDTIIEDQP